MARSAGIESNTGSLVVIIFWGDLVLYRVLGGERGDGGCVVVIFSLVSVFSLSPPTGLE
jgi:hypothetical protein